MKVTVITPTYNHEKYIAKCIESVLSQTYTDWEQIIVDDGSTDRTESIVRDYVAKDSRIKYIRKEHEGIMNLKNAYNLALENANGDLIAILEGDDYWPDYKLEVQVPYFKDDHVALTWGRAEEVDLEGNLIRVRPDKIYIKSDQIKAKRLLIMGNYIPAVTIIIRKSSLEKIGGFQQFPDLYAVDHTTLLALIPFGDFLFINTLILGYWVKHGQNTTIKYKDKISPIYKSAYYYYKKMPKDIRKDFATNDFIIWLELNMRLIKQFIYNFRKRHNLFFTPRNDD